MRAKRVDRTFLYITTFLVVAGILIFFSASLSLIAKSGGGSLGSAIVSQVILGMGGGALALFGATFLPLKELRRYAPHLFIGSVIVTLMVFLPYIGVTANGATRWVDLGLTTFQPSEILKLGFIVALAAVLAGGRNRAAELMTGVVPFAVLSVVTAAVLLLQPDTDTLAIILAAGVAMMFAAGMRLRDFAVFALVGAMLVGALLFMRPYLLDRVQTFFDPGRDPQGSGYQIQQSLIAVGSGGVWGRGYGQSIQKFNYLPEASTDSIFAVYAEEFGFLGGVLLICAFLFFALRGMWIAARAEDTFGALLALGIVVLIVSQAFLNIAAMIAIAPVGGLPLPFVSHGGTALLTTMLMAGLVLNVSKTVRVS